MSLILAVVSYYIFKTFVYFYFVPRYIKYMKVELDDADKGMIALVFGVGYVFPFLDIFGVGLLLQPILKKTLD